MAEEYTVLCAGHGGKAMAAHLALMGAKVALRYGVSVRRMESIIHRTDYWRRGRTVERLGLEQWSVGELTERNPPHTCAARSAAQCR